MVDAALADNFVLKPIQKWTKAISIRDLRPHEVIKDDRIPVLLRALNKPTFLTIDEAGFWKKEISDPRYAVCYFAVAKDQQELIPGLLRRLLRLAEFKTKSARMGKVARVSTITVKYYRFQNNELHTLEWPE